jgi:NAD+ synthase (glutamine-hydrolysing)
LSVNYVYTNLLGNEAGRAIYDGDAMIASCGTMLATGARFSYADFRVTTAVVDIDSTRMARARGNTLPTDVEGKTFDCITVPFAYPEARLEEPPSSDMGWERCEHIKYEEFTRAICLGLFDYLRKSRSHGFVVSLSGGADSSAVATLAARMVRLARTELGHDGLLEKLGHIPGLEQAGDESGLVRRLLTCVYQGTRNSSDTTRNAARQVAQALGADYLQLQVDSLVDGYVDLISEAIGRKLSWAHDDVALQNIQARARGPGVWLLANLRGALLLATSNRSEAAVGYATMDGDTCGGLSPIAGIDKAFLRRWLRWMKTVGSHGDGPLPALAAVNAQAPTAELRPHASKQTDEADLMPYDVLDVVERCAIRDKQSPLEVLRRLEVRYPQQSRAQLAVWVERFFQLWCRNQWKRERYAPSFHVDDENLDPKTWCRFPILSGGYRRELRQLREQAAN